MSNYEERDGLTMWGEAISAQFREHGQLALNIMPNARRDVDGVVLVPEGDIAKLHALIVEGDERGAW